MKLLLLGKDGQVGGALTSALAPLGEPAASSLVPEAIRSVSSADYPTPAVRTLNSRLDTGKLRAAFGLDLPDWREDARRWILETLEEEGF